jgi:hypothetical protein
VANMRWIEATAEQADAQGVGGQAIATHRTRRA